jgi:hypothetical protein
MFRVTGKLALATPSTRTDCAGSSDGQANEVSLVAWLPYRGHNSDPLCHQSTRHEGNRLRRRAIEPLRVVDEADQRPLLGTVGHQVQHREPDHEAIRRVPADEAERSAECDALRIGQAVEPIQEGTADLVQSGVGELHLGLSPGRAPDAAAGSLRFDVIEQCCLADPGLASHD